MFQKKIVWSGSRSPPDLNLLRVHLSQLPVTNDLSVAEPTAPQVRQREAEAAEVDDLIGPSFGWGSL